MVDRLSLVPAFPFYCKLWWTGVGTRLPHSTASCGQQWEQGSPILLQAVVDRPGNRASPFYCKLWWIGPGTRLPHSTASCGG